MRGDINITSNSQIEKDRLALQLLDLMPGAGGCAHIEGLLIHGFDNAASPKGGLTGGIKWRAADTDFNWINSRVDDCRRMDSSASLNHADIIQTWSGPKTVRMIGFTGSSDYSGMKWMYSHIPPDPPGTRCGGGFCKPQQVFMKNVNLKALGNAYVDITKLLRIDLNMLVWPDTEFRFDNVWCLQGGGACLKEAAGERDLNSLTQTNFAYQEFMANGSPYSNGLVPVAPYNYKGGQAHSQGDYIVFPRPKPGDNLPTVPWGDNIWNWDKTEGGRMYFGNPPSGDYVPSGMAGMSYVPPSR